jgi:type IV pilus assembly protein PilA
MKPELKLKFIQNFKNNRAQGFTLVELLVVIIIIGILTAIALPNFLNQTAKAKQTEAKENINLFNKTQNAHRLEKGSFATSFDALATGSLNSATNTATTALYDYNLSTNATTDSATIIATAKDAGLKGYTGGAVRFTNSASYSIVGYVMCETTLPSATAPTVPSTPGGATPTCGSGTEKISY